MMIDYLNNTIMNKWHKILLVFLLITPCVVKGQDSIKNRVGKYYIDILKDEACDFEGNFKSYYDNGTIKVMGKYIVLGCFQKKLVKDGLWVYYFIDGVVRLEEKYYKGKLIDSKEYYPKE